MYTHSMDDNWKFRINVVEEIAMLNDLVVRYRKEDKANLLPTTLVRLVEAHHQLYEYNKHYDEYLDTRVNPPSPTKKTFWQKLLRK